MTKSILIVGAERGLGLARHFLGRGWDVTGTCRDGDDASDLEAAGRDGPGHLHIAHIDVTRADLIDPLRAELGDRTFDVIYFVAGIYGPVHNSVLEATEADFAEVMLTNCFGPIRLARRLVDRLRQPGGTLAFMSSHSASNAGEITLRPWTLPGRTICRQLSCYHRRSRIKAKINCMKLLSQKLMARDFDHLTAELQVRIAILNRYTAPGIPITQPAG